LEYGYLDDLQLTHVDQGNTDTGDCGYSLWQNVGGWKQRSKKENAIYMKMLRLVHRRDLRVACGNVRNRRTALLFATFLFLFFLN
jgi:hypothetical protein